MKRIYAFLVLICITKVVYPYNITPLRNVEVLDDGIIVTYQFRGAIYQHDSLYVNSKFIRIPGFGVNDCAGEPAVPFRSDCISLPEGTSYEISILDTQYRDTSFVLSPARPPLFESDTTSYSFANVPPIHSYRGFFPQNIINESSLANYHDTNLLRVCIYPFQYNMEHNIIRSYSLIRYKIQYTRNETKTYRKKIARKTSSFLERCTINNAGDGQLNKKNNEVVDNYPDNQYYLIITTNKYLSSINEFVEWKRMKGKRVIIKSKEQWSSTTEVKDSISYVYNSLGDSLNYLLIVGGENDVPTYRYTLIEYHYTDLYYACMGDNNDYIPEFSRGRILVNTPSEASRVFEKIIQYEMKPIDDTLFYKKGLHVSSFEVKEKDTLTESRRFTLTSEEILNYVQSYEKKIDRVYYAKNNANPTYWNNDDFYTGGLVPDSLRKPTFQWKGKWQDINDSINNGCFYVLKRGHGTISDWSGPVYSRSKIDLLHNENKYPVVFSLCCKTGYFDGNNCCFAEQFLKKQRAGCVGIIAATETSFSGYNDILAETMFDAIWPDTILRIKMGYDSDQRPILPKPVYELGEILDAGLTYMEDVGMNGAYDSIDNARGTLYTRQIFHYFGDPSMMIYTEKPNIFNHPTFSYKNGKIFVQCPCDSTRITFYTPSPSNPIVDSFVGNSVEYETTADSVIICLDKHNYVPFIQTFTKNVYIQNENINDNRDYFGDRILVGNHVTTQVPSGNVIFENAKVAIKGNKVELHPGTIIRNSNVIINGD